MVLEEGGSLVRGSLTGKCEQKNGHKRRVNPHKGGLSSGSLLYENCYNLTVMVEPIGFCFVLF